MRLKLVTFNIHKGVGSLSRKSRIADVRSAIADADVDLVFLQEVVGMNRQHAKHLKNNGKELQTQLEILADDIWPHYAYGRNAVKSRGDHGNAILSRYPIARWENYDISTNVLERRGVLYCEVHFPEQLDVKLHVFCVHLNIFAQRVAQYGSLKNVIQSLKISGQPVIIAGDFNAWDKEALEHFVADLGLKEAFWEVHGKYARTFPALLPVLSLDRIYVKNARIIAATKLKGAIWKTLSDHIALQVELELGKASKSRKKAGS